MADPDHGFSWSVIAQVEQDLLAFLRARTGHDAVALAEPLQRLSGGFDTEVFAVELKNAPPEMSGPLVLRLHRSPNETREARIETAIHAFASARGHPVPGVPIDATGHYILGRPFLLMERAPGATLLAASLTPFRLLDDIHRLVEAAGLSGLKQLADWLDLHRPQQPTKPCICHGDFLPGNIIVDGGKVTGVVAPPRRCTVVGHDGRWDHFVETQRKQLEPVDPGGPHQRCGGGKGPQTVPRRSANPVRSCS